MTSPSANLQGTYPPDTGLRVGQASIASDGSVSVSVAGKPINTGFVNPYGFIAGEPVVVFRGGASWVALGRSLPQPIAQEIGTESISFTTQTGFTVAVTFSRQFPSSPNVFTNINSGIGATAGWNSRAFGISATGFTLFVFGASSTWSGVPVQWFAVSG